MKKNKKFGKIYGAREDKLLLSENLALLLKSGITISEALEAVLLEVSNKVIRKRLRYVADQVEAGNFLSDALADTKLLPQYATDLIKVGEQSGTLVHNLEVLSKTAKREQSLRNNVVSALAYPAFVLGLTMIIGIAITTLLLPRLVTLFDQLDTELPLITKIVLSIGEFMSTSGYWFIPLMFIISGILFYVLFINQHTKYAGQRLLLALPGFSTLIRNSEISRFAFLGNSLLEAGIPLTSVFDSLTDISTNKIYTRFYKKIAKQLMLGSSLSSAINKYDPRNRLFSPSVHSLIAAGEKSGSLAESFEFIGDSYAQKAKHSTKLLTTLMEPVLLVIVWAGVMLLAVSVILPIYDVVGNFNSKPDELEQPTELPQNIINDNE